MRSLLAVLMLLGAGYASLAVLLYAFQHRLLYFPDRRLIASPADVGLEYEDVHFRASDGVDLHGWLVRGSGQRGVVLFMHGNAGNISHRLESIRIFCRLGLDVFIFDYRGYGQSGGRPSERGTYRDAQAAWEYLTGTSGYAPERIVLFGRSLGGAVAARLATEVQPGALVLESTFTSVPDVAAGLYPWLPVRWLSRYRYDTRAYLDRVRAPLLVIHSREDELIPFAHGERVFASARDPKHFLAIDGGHGDGFFVTGGRYSQGLDEFLAQQAGL